MTIVIGTVPGSAKVKALQANPAVALTIDTGPPTWPPNGSARTARSYQATQAAQTDSGPNHLLGCDACRPPPDDGRIRTCNRPLVTRCDCTLGYGRADEHCPSSGHTEARSAETTSIFQSSIAR
jgi:hypothetical protein